MNNPHLIRVRDTALEDMEGLYEYGNTFQSDQEALIRAIEDAFEVGYNTGYGQGVSAGKCSSQ